MAFIARCRIVGAISLVALLGGCTYLPEYVDPIEWADSANEWVTGSIFGRIPEIVPVPLKAPELQEKRTHFQIWRVFQMNVRRSVPSGNARI